MVRRLCEIAFYLKIWLFVSSVKTHPGTAGNWQYFPIPAAAFERLALSGNKWWVNRVKTIALAKRRLQCGFPFVMHRFTKVMALILRG